MMLTTMTGCGFKPVNMSALANKYPNLIVAFADNGGIADLPLASQVKFELLRQLKTNKIQVLLPTEIANNKALVNYPRLQIRQVTKQIDELGRDLTNNRVSFKLSLGLEATLMRPGYKKTFKINKAGEIASSSSLAGGREEQELEQRLVRDLLLDLFYYLGS